MAPPLFMELLNPPAGRLLRPEKIRGTIRHWVAPAPHLIILGSSNGRTADSGSANLGSNPSPRAIFD